MALIGNYSIYYKSPGRWFGGGATGQGVDRPAFGITSPARAKFCNTDWEPKSGIPDGYRPPYTWVIPQKPGGLASRNIIVGAGAVTANGAMGVNATAALAGTGTLTGVGALIVSAVANLTGTGSLSANLLAVLQATAALSGSGSLTGSMTAYGELLAALTGAGALSAPAYATGAMEADITSVSVLSPESLAAAVWNALAASYNGVGTMGEKMNDAGSGSNPWTEVLEGGYTAAEMLRIIAAALAGKLSGADTATNTFVGIDGVTDRIVATVTAEGNRTAITLDGS